MKINFYLTFLLIFFSINSKQNIIIISIPKCGTHLAAKAVELLTGIHLAHEVLPEKILEEGVSIISNTNRLFRSHLSYNKKIEEELINNNFKVIFIYRDPRDQIISSVYWLLKIVQETRCCLTAEQLIDIYINRIPKEKVLKYNTLNKQKISLRNFRVHNMINELILKVKKYYSSFLDWKKSKNVCVLKFENLVGKQGNGNDYLQIKEIKKLNKYLNTNSENSVEYCIKNLFGGTHTFREGKIGSWKSFLTTQQKNLFKNVAGDLLKKLNYEKNDIW